MTYKTLELLTDADMSHLDKYHKDFIIWVRNWNRFTSERKAKADKKLKAEKAEYEASHKANRKRFNAKRLIAEKAKKEKREREDRQRKLKRARDAEKFRKERLAENARSTEMAKRRRQKLEAYAAEQRRLFDSRYMKNEK